MIRIRAIDAVLSLDFPKAYGVTGSLTLPSNLRMQTDPVSRARDLAHQAHAGQVDKAGRPYIEHVARVAAAVADDPEAETVAWLHDVLEDCPGFVIRFDTALPDHLIRAIESVCRFSAWTPEDYYATIRADPLALRVKLADIADNADESRLALLDEQTADRLRRKYAKARRMLGAE